MATSEEKTELVETLKGPRYYRIQLSGYGGESAYMSISKEAHDFWKDHTEQYGDGDLVQYMLSAEDGDFDFEDIEAVPTEAEFLTDEDGDASPWFESHSEFEHTNGVEYGSARLYVDEVDSDEYNANNVAEVVYGKDLQEYISTLEEENNYEVELIEMGCCDEPLEYKYIAQMYSIEKGGFFDGRIETVGDFDPKKLKIYTTEYLNGEDTVTEVHYDGVEVDNDGGDTNGKGYSATVWEN